MSTITARDTRAEPEDSAHLATSLHGNFNKSFIAFNDIVLLGDFRFVLFHHTAPYHHVSYPRFLARGDA